MFHFLDSTEIIIAHEEVKSNSKRCFKRTKLTFSRSMWWSL